MAPKVTVFVGDIFRTNGYGKCKVVKYINAKEIHVKFFKYHKKIIVTAAAHLRAGRVKNPYKPSLYNVGFLGVGKYDSVSHKKLYQLWCGMFRRCYDLVFLSNNPTYRTCSVHKHWHNFQNFCKWAVKQPNYNSVGFCLDKDLRVFGNKIYSSEFCSFVPNKINTIFSGTKVGKSKFPGVWYNSECTKPYYVRHNKRSHYFNSAKNAFKFHCKIHLKYVNNLMNKYKYQISREVYNKFTSLNAEELGKTLFLFYKEQRQ